MPIYNRYEKYQKIKRFDDGSYEIVVPEVFTKGKLIGQVETDYIEECEGNIQACLDDNILHYHKGLDNNSHPMSQINDEYINFQRTENTLLTLDLSQYQPITTLQLHGLSYLILPNLGDNLTFLDFSERYQSPGLKKIKGLECVNTTNIIDMSEMFAYCKDLKELDLSNFNTSNVTTMYGMFRSCQSMLDLDISSFNTSNVTDMRYMFDSFGNSATQLDVSNFDISKVEQFNGMFDSCGLKNINLSNFKFTTFKGKSFGKMFTDCPNLETLDLSNFYVEGEPFSTHFSGCTSLKSVILPKNFNENYLGGNHILSGTCNECSSLEEFNLNKGNDFVEQYPSTPYMTFYKCVSIKHIDISSVDTQGFFDRTFSHCENLESIIFSKNSTCDGGASTFNNCKKLNYIKCSQAMKDAMIENQNAMGLPNSMREGGSGTWEIIN